jgi:hypothetical protein
MFQSLLKQRTMQSPQQMSEVMHLLLIAYRQPSRACLHLHIPTCVHGSLTSTAYRMIYLLHGIDLMVYRSPHDKDSTSNCATRLGNAEPSRSMCDTACRDEGMPAVTQAGHMNDVASNIQCAFQAIGNTTCVVLRYAAGVVTGRIQRARDDAPRLNNHDDLTDRLVERPQ